MAHANGCCPALDVAVRGLLALERKYAERNAEVADWLDDSGEYIAETYEIARADVSALLDKIGRR